MQPEKPTLTYRKLQIYTNNEVSALYQPSPQKEGSDLFIICADLANTKKRNTQSSSI